MFDQIMLVGKEIKINCDASTYNGWKGKIIGIYGSRSYNHSENGTNIVCEIVNPKNGEKIEYGFDPSVVDEI